MKNIVTTFFKVGILLLFSFNSFGQLLTNKGQIIYSESSALIKIEGSVLNDSTGLIDHNGLIIIDSSFIQNHTAISQGNGNYEVYQNWINSGSFIHDTSHVKLTGGLQFIGGDSITDFWRLTLNGNGIKRQLINSETSKELTLNSNELATDSFNMFVSNPDMLAINYNNTYQNEGFVSSLDTGRLIRATNSTSIYDFPTGSSLNQKRFRNVLIQPDLTQNSIYAVSLVNHDSNLDNLYRDSTDNKVCQLNPDYFHFVEKRSGADATMQIAYDPLLENYNSQSLWNNFLWLNNLPNQTGNIGSYNYVGVNNHSFAYTPVILGIKAPITPNIIGDTLICDNETVVSYVLDSLTTDSIYWYISGSGIVTGGQGTDSITVNWGGSNGVLYAYSYNNSCVGDTVSINTTLLPSPLAGIICPTDEFDVGEIINIQDNSSGALSWLWNYGNNESSVNQNGITFYNTSGTYQVSLLVENQYGCTDTAYCDIVVGGEILIPNIITPNGDGSNDFFVIKGLNVPYNLTILNRWGQILYEGNESTTLWDGTTVSGEPVPDGTYYFILNSEKLTKKGALTVLR